jgi:hypothetical protein
MRRQTLFSQSGRDEEDLEIEVERSLVLIPIIP